MADTRFGEVRKYLRIMSNFNDKCIDNIFNPFGATQFMVKRIRLIIYIIGTATRNKNDQAYQQKLQYIFSH